MSLVPKQNRFSRCLALLVLYAQQIGYEVTFADVYRTPEQAELNAQKGSGIASSVHTIRLAADLNLFRNGEYLTDTESHRPLGEFWKTLDPEARWGGDFGDGNHYSFFHNGVS